MSSELDKLAGMIEHRLYKWVAATGADGNQVVACMLLQTPFDKVVVDFGNVELLDDGNLSFQWRIIDSAECQEDLSTNNTVLTKYLERVVIDRLKEIGETEDVEGNSTNDSGTD